MSKKFSIVQSININKIYKEINEYILQNNCFEPYIFMNEETIEAIIKETPVTENISDSSPKLKHDGVIGAYAGYKVFINNDLSFGIVEIR